MKKHGYTPEEPSYILVEYGYIDAMILMANLLHGAHKGTNFLPQILY